LHAFILARAHREGKPKKRLWRQTALEDEAKRIEKSAHIFRYKGILDKKMTQTQKKACKAS